MDVTIKVSMAEAMDSVRKFYMLAAVTDPSAVDGEVSVLDPDLDPIVEEVVRLAAVRVASALGAEAGRVECGMEGDTVISLSAPMERPDVVAHQLKAAVTTGSMALLIPHDEAHPVDYAAMSEEHVALVRSLVGWLPSLSFCAG